MFEECHTIGYHETRHKPTSQHLPLLAISSAHGGCKKHLPAVGSGCPVVSTSLTILSAGTVSCDVPLTPRLRDSMVMSSARREWQVQRHVINFFFLFSRYPLKLDLCSVCDHVRVYAL
jgi:hypothetical protein